MKKQLTVILIVLVAAWALGCSSAEEKMMAFFEKGRASYGSGNLVDARLELKNAVQIDPKFAQGFYYLGLVERKARDYLKAFDYFSKAVQLDETLLEAQLELGRMYMGAKDVNKALEKAELILASEPNHVGAIGLKAAVLLQRGKTGEASKLLNELIAKGIGDEDIYMLLALTALQQKDQHKARSALQKGVAAYPDAVKIYSLLTDVEIRAGRFAAAELSLQRMIDLEPKHPEHRLRLADLLWRSGHRPRALQSLEEMLARDPGNEELRLREAKFYLAHDENPTAEKILKEGLAVLPDSFELRFVLSDVYLKAFKVQAASEVLEGCLSLKQDPGHSNMVQAKILLARARLAGGEVASAETLLDEVIEASPENVDAHFSKGQIYMLRRQGTDAVSEFRTVISEKPEFVEGHLRLAEAYLLNTQDELALGSLLKASRDMPASKDLHRALAQLYAGRKDYEAAEKQLNRILSSDPQDYATAADLGDLLALAGQPERAEALYRRICEQAPSRDLGFLKLSRFYEVHGRPDEAVEVLARALESPAASLRLLAGLVDVYLRMGKAVKALEACQKSVGGAFGQAAVHNLMGTVYLAEKDYPHAEKALNKAIELEPLWPVPYGNLAKVLLARGRTDAAIDKIKAMLEANPHNPGEYLALSKLYEQKGDYRGAIEVYAKALAVYPNMWVAANNLAFLLCENAVGPEDLARAQSWGRKAVEMRPDDPSVQDTVAWIAFKQGNHDQARMFMEKAMAAAAEEPVLNYHMGAILAESGRVIEAREKLTAALAGGGQFPGREAARVLLARLNR